MRRNLIILFAILFSTIAFGQGKRFTISGHIYDIESSETLIGAGVLSESNNRIGTVSNEFGYYSLSVPIDKLDNLRFIFSYIGYTEEVIELSQAKDTIINIALKPSLEIKEAVVVAHKEAGIKSNYLGSVDVPLQHIKQSPMLLGENDVLKSLQLLPGVQSGNEGFTGLFVRGGGPDENLVMLDGIPIYNVDHLLGIFSVFQTEAVKKVTLYKGSFPARYSGRVSSIVDVRTNDGNMKETEGSFTIGLVTDKFHLEGPIIKDKLSYSVSARGTLTGLLLPLASKMLNQEETGTYFFYDINSKLSWRINDRDRLYLGAYLGSDVLKFENNANNDLSLGEVLIQERYKMGYSWGNKLVSLRWNHIFSNQLFANTTIAYNQYKMKVNSDVKEKRNEEGMDIESIYSLAYHSSIQDISARIDFDYKPSSEHIIKFGGEFVHHIYTPQSVNHLNFNLKFDDMALSDTLVVNQSQRKHLGSEVSIYAEDNMKVGERFTLNPGLLFAVFNTQSKTYYSLQPRLNTKLSFDVLSVKAGYSRMAQYVHLLSSSSFTLPMDLWVPITKDIRPVTSDQFSLGFYSDTVYGWEFSLEGYLKLTKNILEYKEGTSSIMGSGTNWEDNVAMGEARAFGVELMAEKTLGVLTGWLSYTWSKSDRIFPDGSINAGRWFPYKYDRRHSIDLALTYKPKKNIDLNLTWQYSSGGTTTVATGKTAFIGVNGIVVEDEVLDRNNLRLPPSHNLNIGINIHKAHRKGESVWNFSVYNVYNQKNPNIVMAQSIQNQDGEYKLALDKITILPLLPSLSYTRTF